MNAALRPRLIVVAGPNGAGKTSITEQFLRHEWMGGCTYVNPDAIARDEFGDWNAPDAVQKAAIRAANIREQCLRDGNGLAFETVLSMPDKIDFIQRAKQAGFFVRLFFVGTDAVAEPIADAALCGAQLSESTLAKDRLSPEEDAAGPDSPEKENH